MLSAGAATRTPNRDFVVLHAMGVAIYDGRVRAQCCSRAKQGPADERRLFTAPGPSVYRRADMPRLLVFQHVAAELLGTLDALIRARGHRIRFHNFERTRTPCRRSIAIAA